MSPQSTLISSKKDQTQLSLDVSSRTNLNLRVERIVPVSACNMNGRHKIDIDG